MEWTQAGWQTGSDKREDKRRRDTTHRKTSIAFRQIAVVKMYHLLFLGCCREHRPHRLSKVVSPMRTLDKAADAATLDYAPATSAGSHCNQKRIIVINIKSEF